MRTCTGRVLAAAAAVVVVGLVAAPPATAQNGNLAGNSADEHSEKSGQHGKPQQHGKPGQLKVIATGLDNPRGITVGPGGALYVAEAGRGGEGPCAIGPEGEELCLGLTGAITKIKHGHQRRVLDGLPSLGEHDGGFATGPARVDFDSGRLLVLMMNPGGGPESREQFGPDAANLGTLLRFATPRWSRELADFPVFEAEHNPDGGAGAPEGQEIDSNPFGLYDGWHGQAVTDAGGNDLLWIDRRGRVSVLATFPVQMVDAPPFLGLPPGTQIPSQSVPTSVTKGPEERSMSVS